MVGAGLLVGVGTRFGSGCTSGHGICGLSRFSKRSLVATMVFIGGGALTIVLTRALGSMAVLWNAFTVLLSRLLFSFGSAVGGMRNPARVVGFLDFFGEWDPTLAFVMGGA
jgi:uncharacterized membrane protein YedE/YeeE